jgi:predicted TPR repeat methyltransferase
MTKKPELDTAYSLKSPEDNKRLYAKWAQTYDHEFADHMGYALPSRVADTFVSVVGSEKIGRVLDVGAGTGLVGQRLAAHGLARIDALDISVEMLAVAASKGCYNAMIEGDLMGCLPIAADTYDFIISAGTFTHGHVDAAALDELLRITKPGALFCLSINSAYFVPAGFEGAFEGLAGRIQNLELRPVQFYLEEVSGPHAKDHGVIALFRKSVI